VKNNIMDEKTIYKTCLYCFSKIKYNINNKKYGLIKPDKAINIDDIIIFLLLTIKEYKNKNSINILT
jgi:hypothetical protein